MHYLEMLHHSVLRMLQCLSDATISYYDICLGDVACSAIMIFVLGTLPAVLLRYICSGNVVCTAKHDL